MKTIQISDKDYKKFQHFVTLTEDQNFNKLIDILRDKQVMYKFLYMVEILNKTDRNISFETWNKQFIENNNLNEPVTEYNTSLNEFRKLIFDSENNEEGDLTYDEFKQSLKTW